MPDLADRLLMDRMSPWRKVAAAERFLRHMEEVEKASGDREAFEDYLGAFLSAAQSAIDYVVTHAQSKSKGADAGKWRKAIRTSPLGTFFYEARDLDVHLSHLYKGLQQPMTPRADLREEVTSSFTGRGDAAEGSGVFYYRDLSAGVADSRVVAVCGQYLADLRKEIRSAEGLGYF